MQGTGVAGRVFHLKVYGDNAGAARRLADLGSRDYMIGCVTTDGLAVGGIVNDLIGIAAFVMFGIVRGGHEIIRDAVLQTMNGELGCIGYVNRRVAFGCAGSGIRRAGRRLFCGREEVGFLLLMRAGVVRLCVDGFALACVFVINMCHVLRILDDSGICGWFFGFVPSRFCFCAERMLVFLFRLFFGFSDFAVFRGLWG